MLIPRLMDTECVPSFANLGTHWTEVSLTGHMVHLYVVPQVGLVRGNKLRITTAPSILSCQIGSSPVKNKVTQMLCTQVSGDIDQSKPNFKGKGTSKAILSHNNLSKTVAVSRRHQKSKSLPNSKGSVPPPGPSLDVHFEI